jgi:DNA-3-methyladenine glycosylase
MGESMTKPRPLPKSFFRRDVDDAARALIGTVLTVGGVGGMIVETESYDPDDPASHAYERRQTRRNAVMFGPPGHAYVYRIYGMHWCLNFTCGDASAVLIRALEPLYGIAKMRARRGSETLTSLCSGPGKLCQALGITGAQNGLSLSAPPFALARAAGPAQIASGVRIGITKARDLERRFGLAGSPYLSRRFPEMKS